MLLSTDWRLPGTPFSPGVEELIVNYFKNGWHEDDLRYRASPIVLRKGVALDQDYATADEFERSPFYQDHLARWGYRWSASLGLNAGGDIWAIPIQRTLKQGPFEPDEAKRIATLWRPLSDAATLSRQLGFARLLGAVNGLDHVAQAAIALDRRGHILAHNAAVEAEFGVLFERLHGQLAFYDRRSQARFDALIAAAILDSPVAAAAPAAIRVSDRRGRPAQLRAVTLRDWGRYAFTGARVLLLSKRVDPSEAAPPPLWTYGLTPAEQRLASQLVSGVSLAEAAAKMGIGYETARAQLKSIFVKTGTHRQAELVALIAGGKSGPKL